MNALPSLHRARAVNDDLLCAVHTLRGAEHRCALLLGQVRDERLYLALGFAHVGDYAHDVLDLSSRKTRDLLHLARRLPDLPLLDASFEAGRVGWTKARELLRVITPETEQAWVEHAESVTSRQLEVDVNASKHGEPPPDRPMPDKGPEWVRMVFQLDAAQAQVVQDALSWLAAASGEEHLDRGAALAAMAQRVLHDADGAEAPTAERFRVVLEHCPRCGTTEGVETGATDTVVQTACCDGEVVDLQPGPRRGHLTRTIPPATRRAVLHRDKLRCVVPGCRCRLWLDVHHLKPRSLGGTHDEANLVTLCPVHHSLVHDGVLAVWRNGDGVRVRGPFGERRDPRGSSRSVEPAASVEGRATGYGRRGGGGPRGGGG